MTLDAAILNRLLFKKSPERTQTLSIENLHIIVKNQSCASSHIESGQFSQCIFSDSYVCFFEFLEKWFFFSLLGIGTRFCNSGLRSPLSTLNIYRCFTLNFSLHFKHFRLVSSSSLL
jgi:hypothetical protein